MPVEAMIQSDRLTKRCGHFTAVEDVSFSVAKGSTFFLGPNGSGKSTVIRRLPAERLKEPPEPSPGLNVAMPWVTVGHNLRPEGAREVWGKCNRTILNAGHSPNERFSRPFRAEGLLAFQSQGIARVCSALGWVLMAFQTITLPDFHPTLLTLQ